MKPLKLTMAAFGPFAKKTIIDFEEIGQQGVFLISGSNGSGKTSIFDAISYALYGETSNKDRRDSKSVHSDFTSDKDRMHVSLVFSHQGKVYEAERYGKMKMVKGKRQLEADGVSFSLLRDDGTKQVLADRVIKDVNQAIKDTIGIGREQFARTVMIAQGEFQKIVDAESKERVPLFRSLFHTEIYDRFKEELQQRSREYGEISKNKQSAVLEEMSRAEFSNAYAPGVMPEIGNAELYLEHLNQQNQDDAKQLSAKKIQKETAYQELQSSIEQFTKGQNENKLLDEQSEKERRYKELEALRPQMDEKRERLEKARSAEAVKQYQDRLQVSQRMFAEEEAQKNRLSEKYHAQSEMLRQAQQAFQEAEKAAGNLEELRRNADLLNEALPLFRARTEAEKVYLRAQEQVQKWKKLYQEENNQYEQLSEAYFKGQAGIMASRLQPGDACPVCGSTVHPRLAVMGHAVPSKEKVDTAEQNRNYANEQHSEARRDAAVKKEKWETVCHKLALQNGKEEENVRRELVNCKSQISFLEQNLEKARNTYHHCEKEHNAVSVQISDIEKRIQKLSQTIQEQKEAYKNSLKENGFSDETAYLSALLDRVSMQYLNREINQYDADWKAVNNRLHELKKETIHMQYVNLKKECRNGMHISRKAVLKKYIRLSAVR